MSKPLSQLYHSMTFGQKLEIEFLAVIFLLIIGTEFYHTIEGWRYLDALYFCSSTIATIGYGDFHPKTDIGKIFTIIYQFIGIPFFLYTTSLIISENRKNNEK